MLEKYEYQKENKSVNGIINVINKEGYLMGELELPKISEITGMFIPKKLIEESKEMENNPKINVYLYFTEKNFKGIKRIKLNNIYDFPKYTSKLAIEVWTYKDITSSSTYSDYNVVGFFDDRQIFNITIDKFISGIESETWSEDKVNKFCDFDETSSKY